MWQYTCTVLGTRVLEYGYILNTEASRPNVGPNDEINLQGSSVQRQHLRVFNTNYRYSPTVYIL